MVNFLKKDFILGIGAGFILSAVFVYSFGTPRISDGEVIARAQKLGMVRQQQEDGKAQKTASPVSTSAPAPASTPAPAAGGPLVKVITINVAPGMGSEDIAEELEEKGAIKDQAEFLQIVTKLKAHTRFQNGTFDIQAGESMENIVMRLTGKK